MQWNIIFQTNIKRRSEMRHLFVTLLLVFLCAGTAAATDFNQFNGT